MTDLPLAAAAERLRGRPGRPRTREPKVPAPVIQTAAIAPVGPRLLDVDGAAAYLAVSSWTVRDLIAAGTLSRVVIPLPGGRDVRRVLLDRADLDTLIERWKERV